ncbi:MAG TPA: NADP-dependent oxidoreductase [Gaiellaceae bacterium]|nr:NADP-dependent oxidoreductase [Gaiellaceae bacterium]
MRAIRLHGPGGPKDLLLDEIDVPELGAGEALVRIHAAAITRDELDWPTDRLPAIPAYELSGVVEAVAPDVEGLFSGDEVYGMTPFDRDGAAAELVVVPAGVLAPKPRTLDHVQSAALPLPGLSAWQGLFDHAGLQAGERVLITGAAGGVGHLAVQLARVHGAELAEDDVDLVFDTAGGEMPVRALRPGGRLVSVAEEPAAGTYYVVEPNRMQLDELARLADAGELCPEIDSVFPLEQAQAAFERSMARGKRGKVVLQIR